MSQTIHIFNNWSQANQKQARNKCYTNLNSGQIWQENQTKKIKISNYRSQNHPWCLQNPNFYQSSHKHKKQTRNKCNTNLEPGKIGFEYPTIKKTIFSITGTSIMSPKIHIFYDSSLKHQKQARNKCNTNLEPRQIGDEDPAIKNPDF